jgi:hypothetical protein
MTAAGLLKYIVDQSILRSVLSKNNNYGYNAAIKPLLKLRYVPLVLFANHDSYCYDNPLDSISVRISH